MKTKEILNWVLILVVGAIILLVKRDRKIHSRVDKVEDTLDDILNNSDQILNNSDQTRLALACMIQDQTSIKANNTKRTPVGFKYGDRKNLSIET